jgi:sec-independent protein translocase protein TatC
MAFAYFIVFPIAFGFFTRYAPEGVLVMTDIGAYLSFVLRLFFVFGIAFEVPIAIILLTRMGVLDPDALAKQRPYILIGVFTIAMLLTPPDVFSQTLLAIPMLLLFEIGIFFARRMRPKETTEDEGEPSMDASLSRGGGTVAAGVKGSASKAARRRSKRR